MGGRGGIARGTGRPAGAGRVRRNEGSQLGEGAPGRPSQQPTGTLRKRTLAETWTTRGAGWAPSGRRRPQAGTIKGAVRRTIGATPLTMSLLTQTLTLTHTPTPLTPPPTPLPPSTTNGAASNDPEALRETLILATKREQDPTNDSCDAGDSRKRLRLHPNTETIRGFQHRDTSKCTLYHDIPTRHRDVFAFFQTLCQ